MRISGVFACAALAMSALPSCVDLSPLPYSGPDAGDASIGDAVVDVGDLDALAAECRACLSTGPCASALNACDADPACAAFAACMTDSVCWGSSLSDLSHLSPCILTCSVKAGITSQNSPAVLLVTPLIECAQDPARCATQCAPSPDK